MSSEKRLTNIIAFGERLAQARTRLKLSQETLAEAVGTTARSISRWEHNQATPQPYYLQRLCEVLQITPETLRGLNNAEQKDTTFSEVVSLLNLDEQETRLLLESRLTALSPHWNIPYQRNPFFTGRDDVLQQLHDALHHEDHALPSQSCTLSGLGGIGKTQTAIEYAYRYANDYSALFWIAAQTSESILSSFVALADVLNLPERQEQEQNRVVAAVIRWLNNHDRWLLIFDNVEDIALVKSFLPSARHGFLLFTSRHQAFDFSAQVLDLGPMTLEEGMRFLLRRARLLGPTTLQDHLLAKDEMIIREIVLVMGGLPLALDQAGSYIEATRCSLSDYLQLYQSSHLSLLDERDAHNDHPLSVTRTFTLAFEQLERHHPQAAELLTVCAFLAPEPIPEAFFREGAVYLGPTFGVLAADPFVFHSAIKALLMYSLLQRNPDTQTVTIHRLVQAVLKGRLPKTAWQTWATRLTHAMCSLFPSDEMTQVHYWQDCEQLLSHALACLELSEQWSEDKLSYLTLICHVAAYLSERARYAVAQHLLRRAAYIGEHVLGPMHGLVAQILHLLGIIYLRQGKYELAEPLLQQALSIREETLGTDHPQLAGSLKGLGMIYRRQGKYEQAESLYTRALSIQEETLGTDHPHVAASLSLLASLYTNLGKYEQAESLYTRALRIREQALGTDHAQVATLLNNLADLYREQGKYEQAEPLFEHALQIWERDLGSNHPRVAYPLKNLADLYREQGKYEQAEPLFKRALHIWEQALGPQHPEVGSTLHGLGLLYRHQGKYQQAQCSFERALSILEESLGPRHPSVAYPLCNLGLLYIKQGHFEQARPLLERSLSLREQALGPEHLEVTYSLSGLGQLSLELSQLEQAHLYFERTLHIWEGAFGTQHPEVAMTLSHLGQLSVRQGQFEQADGFLQRALHIWEQMVGPEHPYVAITLHELANLSKEQGYYVQAAALYRRALAIREQQLGREHPDLAESLHDLARLHDLQQHPTEALSCYQQALTIRQRVLGQQHPKTQETRRALMQLSSEGGIDGGLSRENS